MIYNELFYPINQKQNHLLTVRQAGRLNADKSYLIERANSKTNVIALVEKGCLHIEEENCTFTVSEGQSLFLPNQRKYTMYADPDNPPIMYWLNIRGIVFDSIVLSFQMDLTVSNGVFLDLFYEIITLVSKEKDNFNLIAEKIFALLLRLRSNKIAFTSNKKEDPTEDLYEAYICNHIQDDFSVKKMAENFSTSTDAIHRIFKKNYGVTPYRYYQNMRIDFAKGLLEKTDLTIEDIAERLRFTDRNYFSLYFKKRTGYSPAAYRKKYKLTS